MQLNVDGHRNFPLFRRRLQRRPNRPSHFRIKLLKLQPLLLQQYFFQILIDAHDISV